ncbi:MAG: rhodanese-like domain-containing protein [Patescibacteria group bacterium]
MNDEKKNNKVMLIGLLLIALVFVFTFFRSGFKKQDSGKSNASKEVISYAQVSADDLKSKIKNSENIQIIDIRSQDEFKIEHIVDSLNINSEESANEINPEKTIIIIGNSSESDEYSGIIKLLKNKQTKSVLVLTGGFPAWKNSNGNTISIGNPSSFFDQSKVTYIEPEKLKEIVENSNYQKFIIDIRGKQSFDNGHIPGAINIFADDLEKSKDKIPYGKEIFVYGDTETQGFQGGVRLYDLGFLASQSLQGGFAGWKEKGFPVKK